MEHRIQSILALWGLKLEALSTQCSILVTLKAINIESLLQKIPVLGRIHEEKMAA